METIEDEQQVFIVGTQVEVTSIQEGYKNSWYKGTIIHPPKSKKSLKVNKNKKTFYLVEYDAIVEEHEHSLPFREYVQASLIRPLPPASSACIKNFDKFDIVEANYRDGWWVGVIIEVMNDGLNYLVAFVSPYDEIVFSRDELRIHFSWLGGNRWIRLQKKDSVCCPQAGNGSVEPFHLTSVPAEVSAMEMTPSPTKRLKPATIDDAEGRRSLCWKNAVQALEAPPPLRQSCRLSLSEGNTNYRRKRKASGRNSCCSLLLSEENGMNKKNDGMSCEKKMRVYRRKEAIQRFINSLQHGEELGESTGVHDSSIVQGPTSEIAGSHCSFRTEEVQVTGIVDEINDVEEVEDEQGECQSKTLVVNPQSNHNQRWPFTKKSGMWEAIESMDVFKRMPQMPHFSLLNEHKENSREMFAISMMMKFAYVVEQITSRSPDDLRRANITDELLDSLKELESHGFNTARLQGYLKELLEKLEKEKKLRQNLEEVESGIGKCQAEKTIYEIGSSKLIQQMKSLKKCIESEKLVKNLKEQQLAKSVSRKGIISRELHNLQLTKKRHLLNAKCFTYFSDQ